MKIKLQTLLKHNWRTLLLLLTLITTSQGVWGYNLYLHSSSNLKGYGWGNSNYLGDWPGKDFSDGVYFTALGHNWYKLNSNLSNSNSFKVNDGSGTESNNLEGFSQTVFINVSSASSISYYNGLSSYQIRFSSDWSKGDTYTSFDDTYAAYKKDYELGSGTYYFNVVENGSTWIPDFENVRGNATLSCADNGMDGCNIQFTLSSAATVSFFFDPASRKSFIRTTTSCTDPAKPSISDVTVCSESAPSFTFSSSNTAKYKLYTHDGTCVSDNFTNGTGDPITLTANATISTTTKYYVQATTTVSGCSNTTNSDEATATVSKGSIAKASGSTTFSGQYLDAAGTNRNFTYTISCGASTFSAEVTSGSSDYSVGTLSTSGSTLTVPVTFRPSTHGARNGTITISYKKTDNTTSTATLNLTGTGNTLYVVGSAFSDWNTFNPMSYDRETGKYYYSSNSPSFGTGDDHAYKILTGNGWGDNNEAMYKDANWTFSKTGMDSNCAIGAYDNGSRNNSIIGSLESSDYTTPVTLYVTANTSTITAAKTLEVKAKLDCTVPASAQYPITGNGTVTYNGTNSQSPTITPAEGAGNITSTYYTGTGGTSYTESTTVPTNAGTYTVTVDVNKGSVYCSATKLTAGTFTISKKAPTAGDFNYGNLNQVLPGDIVAVSVTKKDGINGMGTVNNIKYAGNAQLPTAAGTYAVTFDVSAGTNYTSGEELSAGNLVISKSSQTTPTVSDMTTCDTGNYTLSATGGESTGYYNYAIVSGGSGTATISYNSTKGISTLNVTDRGTVKIKVLKLGDANYEDSGWSDVKEFNFVAAPTVLELTNPSGKYTMCSDGSITLKIASTQSGYTYQLYQNGVKFGDPVSGGGDKTFEVNLSGIYTAKAYYGSSESSCLTDMDGTITLNISTTPNLVRSTPEVTNYSPVTITSINSDIYKWQVKDDTDTVVCDTDPDNPIPGTTAYLYDQTATSITFKGASDGSVYKIIATTKGGCSSDPAEIEVNIDTPCN